MPVSMAILTLVPTPSLAATSTGSLKPARFRSNSPPNPPISASAPGRAVAFTSGFIRSTLAVPSSTHTPHPPPPADLGIGTGPRRRLHQRLDQVHHAVAGVDIDAGLRITQA